MGKCQINQLCETKSVCVLLMVAKAAVKSSTVKSSAGKKSCSAKPPVMTLAQVTGGRGTLKRRRQLQQLMDYHQQQLEDADLFSSTPYRSNKLITVSLLTLFFFTFFSPLFLL